MYWGYGEQTWSGEEERSGGLGAVEVEAERFEVEGSPGNQSFLGP